MSPTDLKLLRRFFADRMIPASEQLRRDGVSLMTLGPDADDTWFVAYAEDTPEFTEFDSDDTGRALSELWDGQGLAQLVDLARAVGQLAAQMQQPLPTKETDVSPFMYVMF